MSQFVADWIKGERDNHSRLLYQLKRELAEMRRDTAASKPNFPAERSRIDKSDRPSFSDRPSTDERSGERLVVRTPMPTRQVMYR